MVKLWNPDDGQVVLTLRGHRNRINPVSFTRDGRMIYLMQRRRLD